MVCSELCRPGAIPFSGSSLWYHRHSTSLSKLLGRIFEPGGIEQGQGYGSLRVLFLAGLDHRSVDWRLLEQGMI